MIGQQPLYPRNCSLTNGNDSQMQSFIPLITSCQSYSVWKWSNYSTGISTLILSRRRLTNILSYLPASCLMISNWSWGCHTIPSFIPTPTLAQRDCISTKRGCLQVSQHKAAFGRVATITLFNLQPSLLVIIPSTTRLPQTHLHITIWPCRPAAPAALQRRLPISTPIVFQT